MGQHDPLTCGHQARTCAHMRRIMRPNDAFPATCPSRCRQGDDRCGAPMGPGVLKLSVDTSEAWVYMIRSRADIRHAHARICAASCAPNDAFPATCPSRCRHGGDRCGAAMGPGVLKLSVDTTEAWVLMIRSHAGIRHTHARICAARCARAHPAIVRTFGAVTGMIAVALLWGRGCSNLDWTSPRHGST